MMEYYSVIKRNALEPVLMRRMNLEPIIQSEASQKEKSEYYISTHMYGSWKDGTEEPICRAAKETQTNIRHTGGRREWGKLSGRH